MHSTKQPMLWVHATINGIADFTSVAMRERETLEEAMGRGACILIDHHGGTYAKDVWSETMDYFEVDTEEPLMDGQNPGAIIRVSGTGTTAPRDGR